MFQLAGDNKGKLPAGGVVALTRYPTTDGNSLPNEDIELLVFTPLAPRTRKEPYGLLRMGCSAADNPDGVHELEGGTPTGKGATLGSYIPIRFGKGTPEDKQDTIVTIPIGD
jgi:hypothetical protein